ncbi:MAG: ABC transporter permease subunit [Sulfolobales archaeon]
MMSLSPIIYDLRRSILRISTIMLLLLALLAGVGLTYLLKVSLLQGGVALEDVNFIGALAVGLDRSYLLGAVFNKNGEPLSSVRAELYLGSSRILETFSNDSGLIYAELNTRDLMKEIMSQAPIPLQTPASPTAFATPTLYLSKDSANITVTGVLYTSAGDNRSMPLVIFRWASGYLPLSASYPKIQEGLPYTYLDSMILAVDSKGIKSMVFGFSFDGGSIRPLTDPLYYNISKTSLNMSIMIGAPIAGPARASPNVFGLQIPNINLSEISLQYYGNLRGFLSEVYLKAPEDLMRDLRYGVVIIDVNKSSADQNTLIISFNSVSPITAAATGTLSSSIAIIMMLFTISVVYLSNQLMARPRSSGELEFILSKPITRRDLFINRYVAQLVSLAIMTLLFTVVFQISTTAFLGFSYDALTLVYLYASVMLALAGFLSLIYSIATSLRSGMYMGLAILLYMILVIFWDAIMFLLAFTVFGISSLQDIQDFTSRSLYFNPRIATRFFVELAQNHIIGTQLSLDPLYVAISIASWIFIPPILAYIRFRRIPLYT